MPSLPLNRLNQQREQTVIVEIGRQAEKPQVLRDGYEIANLAMNEARINEILVRADPVKAKVVTQSVPAGVPVPKGTAIDLVFAVPEDLPTGIIAGSHRDFELRPMKDIYREYIVGKPEVQALLTTKPDPRQLTREEKQVIVAALGTLPLDNSTTGGFDAAYTGLNGAFTFING